MPARPTLLRTLRTGAPTPYICMRCISQPANSNFSSLERDPKRRLSDYRRWERTPPAMVAPVSLKKHDPANAYAVNTNPRALEEVYRNVFGTGGDRLLSEEVMWLAVTHKSFDQGRRGYNDRLAYLGE